MLEDLKQSPEAKYIVDQAVKYLRGLKGNLVQEKKRAAAKAMGISSDGASSRAPALAHNGSVAGNPSVPLVRGDSNGVHTPNYAPLPNRSQAQAVPWNELPVEDRLRILARNENY